MKKLLIPLIAAGLLGTAPLALADPGRNESGFQKVHGQHDGYLKKKIRREHPGYRGRGHHKHRHHHRGGKWHKDRYRHDYRGGHGRSHDDGHHRRRAHRDHDRRGSYFGIADGNRGVLIWKH